MFVYVMMIRKNISPATASVPLVGCIITSAFSTRLLFGAAYQLTAV
jgi:hypothetical protein